MTFRIIPVEFPSRNYNLNVDVNAVYEFVITVNLICHERGQSLVCIRLVLPEDLMSYLITAEVVCVFIHVYVESRKGSLLINVQIIFFK